MPRGPSATSSRGTILAAALALFSSKGYEATTIEDVRDASGASTGSIYHHFGSKQSLAAALFVEGLAGYQAEVIDVLRSHSNAEEGVRALVRHFLHWTRKNRALARFILTSRAPDVREMSDPALQAMNDRFWSETRAWRDARHAEGQIVDLPADIYRSVVLGPAEAYARRWLSGRTETAFEDAVMMLSDAAWRAVRPPQAAEAPAPRQTRQRAARR